AAGLLRQDHRRGDQRRTVTRRSARDRERTHGSDGGGRSPPWTGKPEHRRGRWSRRERGTVQECGSAAVEFALVLPLVLILALATLEVALLMKDQLIVQGSARAGARQASVSTDDQSVRQAAMDAAPGLDPDRL